MATPERTPVACTIPSDRRSFTEALREKYCFAAPEEARDGFILKINIRGKPKDHTKGKAELGFLRNVVLSMSNITHAGLPQLDLSNLCPNVVDLDLSGNFITSWHDIIGIFRQLKQLKYANLTGNPLNADQEALQDETLDLPAVENLVLNWTWVSWTTVAALCQRLPTLHELHICANDYTAVSEETIPHLSNIVCLRMNNNCIKRWTEIAKLSSLPKLKSLILSENPIEDVSYENNTSQASAISQSQSSRESQPETENLRSSADMQTIKAANVSHESMVHSASSVCQNIINEVVENACGDAAQVTTASKGETNESEQPGANHDQLKEAGQSENLTDGAGTVAAELQDSKINDSEQTDAASAEHQDQPKGAEQSENLTDGDGKPDAARNDSEQPDTAKNDSEQANVERNDSEQTGAARNDLEQPGAARNDSEYSISAGNDPEKPAVASAEPQDQPKEAGQCRGAEAQQPQVNVLPFAELESLCVSSTSISSFDDLRALSQFPKLHSLRIKSKSIFPEVSEEERRKMLIACLPRVSILNGSNVTDDERNRSEMDFLQKFKANPDPPIRYEELVAKHGKPVDMRNIDLGARYCEWADVTIVANNAPIRDLTVHVVKPIGKLRTQLATKVLGIPQHSFRMYHLACGPYHNEPEPEVAFDELLLDNLPLSRHDVMHGDEIHIEILNADKRVRSVQGLLKQNLKKKK